MVIARSNRPRMRKSRMSASATMSSIPARAARSRARSHIAGLRSSAVAAMPRRASSMACSAGPAASSSTERIRPRSPGRCRSHQPSRASTPAGAGQLVRLRVVVDPAHPPEGTSALALVALDGRHLDGKGACDHHRALVGDMPGNGACSADRRVLFGLGSDIWHLSFSYIVRALRMRRIGKRRAAVCALAAALGGIAGTAALTATASAAVPAGGPGSAAGWQVISYDGISLRVPASWPVVNLATAPSACPRLDVHAVYLGTQGTDPSCPAAGVAGKTEAVQIAATSPGSPEALAATQATTIGGRAARTNPDAAVTHTITDVTGGTQVSLSYGGDPALIAQMRSSISVTSAVTAQAASAAVTPAGQVQGIFQGGGFDPCTAPSSSTMNAWLASPYRAIGAYIGGINRACAQPNLTSSWINTVEGQGWKVFPLYPGLQASCGPSGNAAINPNNAAAQGASSADDAAAQAASLG